MMLAFANHNPREIFTMRNQDFLKTTGSKEDHWEESKIVGYCQIGNSHFPIIEVQKNSINSTKQIKSNIDCTTRNQLFQFELNGQLLAAIEAEESSNPSSDAAGFLTEREMQIATLVAKGNSNKQIASQLNISTWTVSTHLRRIFVKLGVDTRAAMVYRCVALNDNPSLSI
jgi:ATP/maltotriose-dependent transcriptional regulator MalT